jgi:hypothetical protein
MFILLVQILQGNKMKPAAKNFVVSQIKVTAFIQGIEFSHCFNKSSVNCKSFQIIR